MLVTLFFTCQLESSRVVINPQMNSILLITMPNHKLKPSEHITCTAQTDQTAVYEVQIGSITFRSEFQFYRAFSPANVTLLPLGSATAMDATRFVLASYSITFLSDTLVQSGAAGQMLATIYDYNDCIETSEIAFTTNIGIQPSVRTNPNCLLSATGDVLYKSLLNDQLLYSQTVNKVDFDFKKLAISGMECKTGDASAQTKCTEATVVISSSNFVSYRLFLVIPRAISTKNLYTDPYGIAQVDKVDIPFNLIFEIVIKDRITSGDCVNSSQLTFFGTIMHVLQTPLKTCPFQEFARKEYWITVSEVSGFTFQLQFFTEIPFSLNQYITCATWEISDFTSLEECSAAMQRVSANIEGSAISVIYKAWNAGGSYIGAYIFSSDVMPGGEVDITLTEGQLCVDIKKQISSTRTFATISIKISQNLQLFQNNEIQYQQVGNFNFPSIDSVYCYIVDKSTQFLINQISFRQQFGVVDILGNQFQINTINPLVAYQEFWEGWVLWLVSFIVALIWVITRVLCRQIKQKKRSLIK
ncbi:hypothetical protein SS50377_22707 [Spironucleus salmonicida]|uniref:Transmembrane protein n=1 Tax=Spironucleus salmonicida TaxID=348837 RepID=V6LHZ7_9EUKA|nr:hypothetical protein SS50377_22707 [Spironucleus salmonicida]|eukprot:EST44185.1 Hypothetical protein SS50377_15990 [Spironucleus salmonicida]